MDVDPEETFAGESAEYIVGKPPETRRTSSVGAGIAFAALGLLSFGFILASMLFRGGSGVLPGWSATVVDGIYRVAAVDRSYITDLRPGDRIEAVAGDRQAGFYGPELALSRVPPSSRYDVTITRVGRPETFSLRLKDREGSWKSLVPNLVVSALLYVLAVWIGSVKFRDVTGKLATLTFVLTVFTFFSVVLAVFPGWSRPTSAFALAVTNLARPLNLPVGFHFFSRFPQPIGESVWGIALRRALYASAVLLWLPLNIPSLAHILGAAPSPVLALMVDFGPGSRPGGLLLAIYEALTALLMGLVLARNYRGVRDPDSARRLRWAGMGFSATLGIFLVFTLLRVLSYLTGSALVDHLAEHTNDAATAVIALSCMALAYAVARHRVLGIHVVIRRGLQYLLAKNALQVIVVLPVLILLVEVIRHPDQPLRDVLLGRRWPFYAVIIVTGAISLRYRRQMRTWLDRRFFLPQLKEEGALLDLVGRLKAADSEAELCLGAAREIDGALHVNGLHILVREPNGMLRVAYSQTIEAAARLRAWLVRQGSEFLSSGSVFTVYDARATRDTELPAEQAAEQLIVPLIGTKPGDLGALVLGPKRSDQPYTGRDQDLLKAVGGQIALVYEVLRLRESVEHEKRVRVRVLGQANDGLVSPLSECPICGRCFTVAEAVCADDGAALTLTLPVAATIDGKYRLQRRIGRGGMGVVYEADDLRLVRKVAIKIMIGELFGESQANARFEREARAAAAMNHANVICVYDVGKLGAGGAYLVMELVRGISWRQGLKEGWPIGMTRVSSWMKQLCFAVEAAHAKGIVHRDLKPENIMIAVEERSERVVVLDFGLAKLRPGYSDRTLTLSGAVMGTLGYMSPEQRAGRKIDAPTDVFALAVICAETLTGRRPPRTGVSPLWAHDALRRSGTSSVALDRCLARALAERPSRRPAVTEFWQELSGALAEAATTSSADAVSENMETLPLTPPPSVH